MNSNCVKTSIHRLTDWGVRPAGSLLREVIITAATCQVLVL